MNEIVTSLARNAIMAALGLKSSFDLDDALKKYPELGQKVHHLSL